MIEIIYKEERKENRESEASVQIPKNIRQIGLPGGYYKIYMEDYVNTFLRKVSDEAQNTGRTALLLGQVEYLDGITYIFIRCALGIDQEVSVDCPPFEDRIWAQLNEEMGKRFPGEEVVGWFFTAPSLAEDTENQLYKTHVTHFGGEKVLLLMEAQEKEEAFFRYDQGKMSRQQGYYIYYEKNPEMQAYLIEQSQNRSMESEETVQDQAVKTFRQKNTDKTDQTENRREAGNWIPTVAAAAVAVVALAAGTNFLGSYDKMQKTTEQVLEVSAQILSERTAEKNGIPVTQIPEENRAEMPSVTPHGNLMETPGLNMGQNAETGRSLMEETAPKEESVASGSIFAEKRGVAKTYQIREGDTLNKICMRIYGNLDYVEEICEMNQIMEGETIYPGEIIVLP